MLFIAKLLKRFLKDEDGPAEEFFMRCLKPKLDTGTTLEDTPKHLPPDEDMLVKSLYLISRNISNHQSLKLLLLRGSIYTTRKMGKNNVDSPLDWPD